MQFHEILEGKMFLLTKRNVCRHAECHCGGQGGGFGKEVEVPQSKGQLDRLIHLYCNLENQQPG